MATIRLHLIGYDIEYIFKLTKHSFTIIDIVSHLIEKGLTISEIKDIKFIHNGKPIDNSEFKIYESNGDIFSINMYTHNKIIFDELIKNIFKPDINSDGKIVSNSNGDSHSDEDEDSDEESDNDMYGNYNTMKYIGSQHAHEHEHAHKDEDEDGDGDIVPLKREPLPDNIEDEEEDQSEEELDKINKVIVSDLKDPDFIKLLHICITKPDYLDKAARYITNGTMVDKIDNIEKIEFDYIFFMEYEKLVVILSSLDIKIEDKMILSIITYFKGNINLSLRYIISIN
jgi:hypothetical protein